MKKTIITIIITIISTSLLLVGSAKLYANFEVKEYNEKIENPGIKEVKAIDYDVPECNITINGIYSSLISRKDLKNINTYEISAVMNDGIYKDLYTYHGIRFLDLLKEYEIEDYNSVTFKSNGNLQVKFNKEEINDDFYLAFDVDGKLYSESEPVGLIIPSLLSRYSISNIIRIDFD